MIAELPWSPEERWAALCEMGNDEPTASAKLPTFSNSKFVVVEGCEEPQSPCEISWSPTSRYNSVVKISKELNRRGAKSVEHLQVLRTSDPCYGSLAPTRERVGKHELPYDPVKRYNALAKFAKAPKGTKTSEHLKILRASDPCYGSLGPAKERVGKHELPYDPVRRFAAMAGLLKEPRGTKAVEHLRALHASNPCYGSLIPARERIGAHELPYDPSRRYIALSKLIGGVRGEKTFEHLENLRLSDPSYGSLVPSSFAAERQYAPKEIDLSAAEEPGLLRQRTGSTASGRPLRRILSDQAMYFEDDEEDEEPYEPRQRHNSGAWCPPSPQRNPAYEAFPRMRRASNESVEDDNSSQLSAARTMVERSSLERASNDTITSFLDHVDGSASGEWNAASMKEELAAQHSKSQAKQPVNHKGKMAPAAPREGAPAELA